MLKRKFSILAVATLAILTLGQNVAADEGAYQYSAILEGDYAQAEQNLIAMLESNPQDVYALLNLAVIYQQSGATDRARDVYEQVLTQSENPYAEMATGKPQRVKAVARRGIAALE